MTKLFATIYILHPNISFIFAGVIIKIVLAMKKVTHDQIVINEKLGDFFVDIAKLVFAGVVLSTLLDMAESKGFVLFIGTWSTVVLGAAGFIIYDKANYLKRRR